MAEIMFFSLIFVLLAGLVFSTVMLVLVIDGDRHHKKKWRKRLVRNSAGAATFLDKISCQSHQLLVFDVPTRVRCAVTPIFAQGAPVSGESLPVTLEGLLARFAFESDQPLLILSASETVEGGLVPTTALLHVHSDLTKAGFTKSLRALPASKPGTHDNTTAHNEESESCE